MNNTKKKLIYCGMTLGVLEAVNACIALNSKKLEKKFVDRNIENYQWMNVNVKYSVEGEGKPILLLHNLNPDSSSYEWSRVTPILAGKRKVYTVDLPGCGFSDRVGMLFTNSSYMHFINSFISEIIGEITDIACLGGSVTPVLSACSNGNKLIDNVFMVCPDPLEEITVKKNFFSRLETVILSLPVIGKFIYNVEFSKALTKFKLQNVYFKNSGSIGWEDVDRYYCMAHRSFGLGRILYTSIIGRYLCCNEETLKRRIDNNIYMLIGRDTLYAKDIVKKYSALFPNMKTVVINNTKFMLPLENHLATANAILDV